METVLWMCFFIIVTEVRMHQGGIGGEKSTGVRSDGTLRMVFPHPADTHAFSSQQGMRERSFWLFLPYSLTQV